MNKTEIDKSLASLQEQVLADIAEAIPFSNEEGALALAEAVATLNNYNPKNKLANTVESAPSHWSFAIEETALRILYEGRAAPLDATNPTLARRYRAHGEHHRKLSESLAGPLLQIRPTSMGSGRRR